MRLYLGIDGGGTKTECAIGDGEKILGRFMAGTCKIQRVGKETASRSLQAAIQGALYAAKSEARNVEHCCVGIAGASHPEVVEFVQHTIGEMMAASVTVVGDNIIAHEAAFKGGPGVLIIAGTGSIVYGRNERGEIARAGGWGSVVSDEGSGDWIGRLAVATCLRAMDSGQSTKLTQQVMEAWRIATREDIVRIANSYPAPNFAALFPKVLATSDAGDALAKDLLNRAGAELSQLAKIVIRKLWPGTDTPIHIAGSGGVLRNSVLVRQVLQNSIRAERPTAVYDAVEIDPILGALFLARQAVK